ncbi:flagellar protein FliT [Lentibacillus sp. N15]|uniref:flagellar protein FliT n=1 Tax=Lentibacillus songyuanensis TaxID=3136161 RepID=UPI0031BAD223
MNRLQPLYELTNKLETLLEQEIPAKHRESIIQEINRLIAERGVLLREIHPPFTVEEKQLGEQIVASNRMIQQKMSMLFTVLKQEMKQIQQQQKSNNTYTNPYQHVQAIDGMFLDRKK